jgi:hypothetical protein
LIRHTGGRHGQEKGTRKTRRHSVSLRAIVDGDTGTLLTDHLWFTTGTWSAGLAAGDIFALEARTADYIKGYQGRREVYDAPVSRDWKLQRSAKVTIIPRESVAA